MVLDMFKENSLAISAIIEPSPCDACASREKCKNLELACDDFSVYVETGDVYNASRHPSADNFDLIFSE